MTIEIKHAQVREVTPHPDSGYLVPPLILLKRAALLAATVIYDLYHYDKQWPDLVPLLETFDVPAELRTFDSLIGYVTKHGRAVIDQYTSGVGSIGHVEPVERKD